MSEIDISIAASMWSTGCDTLAIAKRLRMHESRVYLWLDEIKQAAKKARAVA